MQEQSNGARVAMRETISLCIPCYGSELTIEGVVNELRDVLAQRSTSYDYEILCVNDSSPDGVSAVLGKLASEDERIKVIELASNGGKHAALLVAFSFARGSIAVCLDDDGQCPVERLWDLVDALDDGTDMSMARYPEAHYAGLKGMFSDVNNKLACYLFGKPEDVRFSNFNARKRFLYKAMSSYAGGRPNLEGLTLQLTHQIAFVDMHPRKRVAGQSGFSFVKGLNLWLDGAMAFSVKPMRAVLMLGFILLAFSVAFALVAAVSEQLSLALWALAFCTSGTVVACTGVLGEYVSRVYRALGGPNRPAVRKVRNIESRPGQYAPDRGDAVYE